MPTIRRSELALLLQAILIALPVTLLAGAALHLLRNDRAEVEQQARDHARLVAPELARQLGHLAGAGLSFHVGTIVDGQVKLRVDYPKLPAPDDWPRKLTAHQAELWKAAQDATYRQPDAGAARQALRALADSAPAGSVLRANAELGQLDPMDWSGAAALALRFPQAVTPSGTPVAALALLLALRHASVGSPPDTLIQAVESNTVEHPSFLTPEVLDAAKQAAAGGPYAPRVAALQQLFQTQEATREKTRESLRTLLNQSIPADQPGELWLGQGDSPVLAMTDPVRGGWEVSLAQSSVLTATFQKALASLHGLPDYLGAVLEIGGVRLRLAGAPPAGVDPPVLTSAGGTLSARQEHAFTLQLDLSNPAPLYAQYQQRRWLIEGLILSAAATALVGLLTLWTGHRRQARLNEMKSNFVASVSHELRAPIAAVRLMAESLESGRVAGETRQQDYYRLIVQECRRLSTLVGNVLDFARIDQGSQLYRFEPVDAMALLRHTMMVMQPNAEQRHVRLVLSDPPQELDSRQPSWDGEAVEQSLVNLLDNAIKHSPEGAEVRMEMEIRRDAVRLWVRDHGPGIPESDHARIFERFYRRGQELRRETKGVGIGLSIVKHVAEGHGGRVLVESMVGQGSSFGLELPLDAGAPS